jgi:hypothetical protein
MASFMHGEAQGLGLYLLLFLIGHKDLVFFKKCIGNPQFSSISYVSFKIFVNLAYPFDGLYKNVMVLYRITGHAFFVCVAPNYGSCFLHAIGPQDSQTSKKKVTLNKHPPVHHEGWMVSV